MMRKSTIIVNTNGGAACDFCAQWLIGTFIEGKMDLRFTKEMVGIAFFLKTTTTQKNNCGK